MIAKNFIERLIDSDDIFLPIWDKLNEIWKFPKITKGYNIEEIYDQKEIQTNELEKFLSNTFSEIYEFLIERITQDTFIQRILREEKYALVIMDGLSIREANLLFSNLKMKDLKINDYSFEFSALPSDTGNFCKKFFNVEEPSQITMKKNLNFRYYHIVKEEDVERIKGDEKKLVVWCAFPDIFMHIKEKGRAVIKSLEEVLTETLDILRKILERINSDEITLTSDHGYILHRPFAVQSLTGEYQKLMRKIFGMKRGMKSSDIEEEALNKLKEIPEIGNLVQIKKEFLVAKNRFGWSVSGRRSLITHGGLSLMENLIPVIEFRRL
jgi:hypothetical protein